MLTKLIFNHIIKLDIFIYSYKEERSVRMYKAIDIASYVINWCNDNNIPVTNLKLQKLLYFLQGEVYHSTSERLIDDDFYAWQLGPVVPNVYYSYAMYSSLPLPDQTINIEIPEHEKNTINNILNKYARKSTWNLVDLSHEQDPWKYNYQIFGDKSLIPYQSIKDYFKEA